MDTAAGPLGEYLDFWSDYGAYLPDGDLVLAWPLAPQWGRIVRSGVAGEAAAELIVSEAHRRTIDVRAVDGRKCQSLQRFYKQWGRVLRFPHYYGRNSHALTDLTSDLLEDRRTFGRWMKRRDERGVDVLFVLINKADHLLENEPKELSFLLHILGAAANDLPAHDTGRTADPVLLKIGFVVDKEETFLTRVTQPLLE